MNSLFFFYDQHSPTYNVFIIVYVCVCEIRMTNLPNLQFPDFSGDTCANKDLGIFSTVVPLGLGMSGIVSMFQRTKRN